MNERIQELADEATELDYETFDNFNHKTVRHYKFNKEKFAELIVKECANIADEYDGAGSTIVSRIKKHFGVEE
jgi:hypothetical protein